MSHGHDSGGKERSRESRFPAKKRPLAHSKKAPEGANVVRKLGFMNIATNETRFRAVYLMRHHLPVFLISHYQDDATLG